MYLPTNSPVTFNFVIKAITAEQTQSDYSVYNTKLMEVQSKGRYRLFAVDSVQQENIGVDGYIRVTITTPISPLGRYKYQLVCTTWPEYKYVPDPPLYHCVFEGFTMTPMSTISATLVDTSGLVEGTVSGQSCYSATLPPTS